MKANEHALIVGKSGTGKSHLVKSALKAGRLGNRVFILDWKDEYTDLGKKIGILDCAKKLATENPKEFVFRLTPRSDQMEKDCNDIMRLGFDTDDCTIILDECSGYGRVPKLQDLFARGRSYGVRAIAMTQRPHLVNPTVRSEAALCICYYVNQPEARRYLAEQYTKTAVEELETIDPKKYEYCVWGDDEATAKNLASKLFGAKF